MSSNLLYALRTALDRFESRRVFDEIVGVSSWLRSRLREMDFHIVAPDAHACPAVITIALPDEMTSSYVGRRLDEAGYLLSYNSAYLRERNWIQICLMGECPREAISPLLGVLQRFRPGGAGAQ